MQQGPGACVEGCNNHMFSAGVIVATQAALPGSCFWVVSWLQFMSLYVHAGGHEVWCGSPCWRPHVAFKVHSHIGDGPTVQVG